MEHKTYKPTLKVYVAILKARGSEGRKGSRGRRKEGRKKEGRTNGEKGGEKKEITQLQMILFYKVI